MNNEQSSPYSHHDEVWALLPWYANRSLGAAEYQQVKAHLRVCLVCRKELTAQAKLAERLKHEPQVEISAKPAFDRLLSRIHQESGMTGKNAARAKPSRLAPWFNVVLANWQPLPLAAVIALLLAFIIPALLSGVPPRGLPTYHTVADPGSFDRYSQNDLRVVFAAQATTADISHLIHAIHGEVVDGPSVGGVYTIRLAASSQASLAQALGLLRGNPSVVFAESALPQPPVTVGAAR
jgi:hypothetical protein